MREIRRSIPFSCLLGLLVPGLGHIYWKDYAFGAFVFLVMLIASVLFYLSFLISIPGLAVAVLFGLPAAFYLFSFWDLVRVVKNRRSEVCCGHNKAVLLLIFGISFQLLSPTTPGGFIWRNAPEFFVQETERLEPQFHKGDILAANPLAYFIDIVFTRYPIMYALPERGDVVRFAVTKDHKLTGIVLGLPGEQVSVHDGRIEADGRPVYPRRDRLRLLRGSLRLTATPKESILVATLKLGIIDTTYVIPFRGIIGSVHKVF